MKKKKYIQTTTKLQLNLLMDQNLRLVTYGKEGDTLKLDIDPNSHPAWTGGATKILDTEGQVARFKKRFQNLNFEKNS